MLVQDGLTFLSRTVHLNLNRALAHRTVDHKVDLYSSINCKTMEAFSEYLVLALLVLVFSIPVLMNRISSRRNKARGPQEKSEAV